MQMGKRFVDGGGRGVDMGYGVLGDKGEFKPRYGLWLADSEHCQAAVRGLLSEGYDCKVVLKLGARCRKHSGKPFRPVIWLSQYVKLADRGWRVEDDFCDGGAVGCYIREAFFPEDVQLTKAVDERGSLCLIKL